MTTGTVIYQGIQITKGATYTQTRGISPDVCEVKLIPQQDPIPSVGDLALTFNAVNQVVLRDCLADSSRVWLNDQGFVGTINFRDRRWRWSRYELFSAHFNERDSIGNIIEASRLSLQGILRALFTHIGESGVDVSRVPNDFYPEFNQRCKPADVLIQSYGINLGYEVCLGFDDDVVTVWPRGQGEDLPATSELMKLEESLDPATPPQFSSVCFGPSVAQARFAMVAVGLDTDGKVKLLDDLSYKPAGGWVKAYDYMLAIEKAFGVDSEEVRLARLTVYRWYIIDMFADGSLDFPDGTGSLDDITQVLPLFQKLLEVQQTGTEGKVQHPNIRLYGAHTSQKLWVGREITGIGWEIFEVYEFDAYRGMINFERPVYQDLTTVEQILPAELYLEAAFRIRDSFNRQFVSYVHTIPIDNFGAGVHTYEEPGVIATTIVKYDDSHNVTEILSNQEDVDAYAQTIHAATAGSYIHKAEKMAWYNRIMDEIKLDGLTSQVQHIITDGTDPGAAGHMTRAAQNMEFDVFLRSTAERQESRYVSDVAKRDIGERVLAQRPEKGND